MLKRGDYPKHRNYLKVHEQLSRLASHHNVARANLLYLGAATKSEYPVELPLKYI